ncbi:MAG: UDP-N-acetylglucosamine 2-epimerase (non-hydrolyzing) [Magnetococcales bacterium]|nr:UDP-N-acetylglucosamine 2-epimerase (non-hydrolyzing) [Magnetococcales bacterium]
MKMVTIVGARPQFIKAAAISRSVAAHNHAHPDRLVQEIIVHTGQHFAINMSDIFFQEMAIPAPDYRLEIHGLGHGAMTGRMLEEVEKVLQREAPDCVLVYGDTNTTLAGALAAAKLHLPVAHVEAGLRSFNRAMPEEVNRILTDHLATWLFCPTPVAMEHVHNEGLDRRAGVRVVQCGDVMVDVLYHFAPLARGHSATSRAGIADGYLLCTLHRAELTDDDGRLARVFKVLLDLAREHDIVMPLHPRTRQALQRLDLLPHGSPKLRVIDPVGYLQMLDLLDHAGLVLTDSGGLQKEAYLMGRGVVTLRQETEWTETVTAGYNFLAGFDPAAIHAGVVRMLGRHVDNTQAFYGRGDASQHILASLVG